MKGLKHMVFFSLLLAVGNLWGQQAAQFSQFGLNRYVINPSVAGMEKQFEAISAYRTQWTSINDAPRTYTLSLTAPSKDGKMGFGGYLFTDVAGPTRRAGAQLSYSYHLQLNQDLKLSLGASMGVLQLGIDGSQITLRDEDDPAMLGLKETEILPDAKFGTTLYNDNFYAGISISQLFNNKIRHFDLNGEGQLMMHYNLIGGYTFEINSDFSLEPSVLVRYVDPVPVKIDGMLRGIFREMVWLGTSYRSGDAVSVSAGYLHENYLMIGYAYDITISEVQNYTGGSHEIIIGIRFGNEN